MFTKKIVEREVEVTKVVKELRPVTVYESDGVEYTSDDIRILSNKHRTSELCNHEFHQICNRHGSGRAQVLAWIQLSDWTKIYNIISQHEKCKKAIETGLTNDE